MEKGTVKKKCCRGICSTNPTNAFLLIEKPKSKKIGTQIEKPARDLPLQAKNMESTLIKETVVFRLI